jgi:MoxR-like ATPase
MSATPDSNATSLESAIAQTAELALERVSAAREAIGRVIFGQEKVVEEVMVTLMAGGHGLLVGVPGLAKTKLVDTLGVVLGLDARRVQFEGANVELQEAGAVSAQDEV